MAIPIRLRMSKLFEKGLKSDVAGKEKRKERERKSQLLGLHAELDTLATGVKAVGSSV